MSNEERQDAQRENWLCDGNEEPVQEGYLVGDRKGLLTLRAAIDQALSNPNGEASIEELGSSWSHVRVREIHPALEQKRSDTSFSRRVIKYLALTALVLLFLVTIYGCTQLPRLFRPLFS